jgi:ATP-dependent Clp protease protease subunit
MLMNRIIYLGSPINDTDANELVASLIALELADPKADIKLYINSPGAAMHSAQAVMDVMNSVSCDVSTVAVGMTGGNSTLVLASGAKGKRFAMPSARMMACQPIGFAGGTAWNLKPTIVEQNRNAMCAVEILHNCTNLSRDECQDMLDRETFLSPEDAVKCGVIDGIIEPAEKAK